MTDLLSFAVRVSPRREFLAEQILSSEGNQIYLPLENQWRRRSRHLGDWGWVRVPMIPCYLFVLVEAREALEGVLHSGWGFVRGVLGNPATGVPRPITEHEMDYVRSQSEERCQMPAPKVDWAPNKGEWVKIVDRHHLLNGEKVLVEECRGKRAKEFFGLLRGQGNPMVFKVKDVELV